MAKKKETSKVGLKWKRKRWIPIVAPKQFNHKEIGSTFIENEADAVGRSVDASLGLLTGNFRRQNIIIKLKITGVTNERAQTTMLEFKLQPASMKRLIRKAMSKLEDSFCCKTKDDITIRIKPLLTTRSRAKASAKRAIFHKVRQYVVNYVNKITFEQLIQDLVNLRLQKEIKGAVSKIYPTRACHIRYCGIYTRRNPVIVKPMKEEAGEKRKEEKRPKKRPARKRKKKAETTEKKAEPKQEIKPEQKEAAKKTPETPITEAKKPTEVEA
ncbi:MAG: hypothetical protein KAT43_06850 [Nanoarchaeota archaeon]|nr:hypothetical protein [Nanoarchaeota archaeon]